MSNHYQQRRYPQPNQSNNHNVRNAATRSHSDQRDARNNRSNRSRPQSRVEKVDVELNHDFSSLVLKEDAASRPLWVCPDKHIFLETFSPFYEPAYDFLIAIAEPVCRPELIHEYKITKYSLYAAASVGLQTEDLIAGLEKLSKNALDEEVVHFIEEKTRKCGKLRMILKNGRYFLESPDHNVLEYLTHHQNQEIYRARIASPDLKCNAMGYITNITAMENDNDEKLEIDKLLNKKKDDKDSKTNTKKSGEDDNTEIADIGIDAINDVVDEATLPSFAFEIKESEVETVKRASHEMEYPVVEEYDFRNDPKNTRLDISLKAIAKHRPYQEKCLSKMFGNGRARSGLIVLPCGAGKTLVGVTAVATVKRSAIIFANTTVSVHQWCQQILHWSKVDRKSIIEFSSQCKKELPPKEESCILVTTYHMLGHSGRRSKEAQLAMDQITEREWGLLVLDEVHVAPANTFKKCTTIIRSKCKLGLTATLLREDDKIGDLFYLIGPKLYEANWLDLQKNGYLALVQCIEVWCEMTEDFYNEYLVTEHENKRHCQVLSDFNPNKFRAMQYLIRVHEERGDKVLIFSDNIPLLKHSAKLLRKPFIYGKTGDQERKYWLHNFNHTQSTNCLFISSVGDTSIDLPDVNVVIQISSHYGSRRQEAQRLGRILRPKPRQGNEFNAFFYTLVSKDTVDMVYATKRQRFLVDQGYSFHVITNLVNEQTPNLKYSEATERRELLMQVLTLIKSGSTIEETATKSREMSLDQEDEDGVIRSKGSMSRLSGAAGVEYREFSQSASALSSSRGLLSSAPKKSVRGKKRKANTKFFQKREKERKTLKERRQMYLPH